MLLPLSDAELTIAGCAALSRNLSREAGDGQGGTAKGQSPLWPRRWMVSDANSWKVILLLKKCNAVVCSFMQHCCQPGWAFETADETKFLDGSSDGRSDLAKPQHLCRLPQSSGKCVHALDLVLSRDCVTGTLSSSALGHIPCSSCAIEDPLSPREKCLLPVASFIVELQCQATPCLEARKASHTHHFHTTFYSRHR